MPFIKQNQVTISFAEYQDIVDRDQRLFDANEGLTEDVVEPLLVRATERILTKVRSTNWWVDLQPTSTISAVDPDSILARQNDFTDLCVYEALAEYILPMVADFGTEDNAEYRKLGYYKQKADDLFIELITDGSWYDFDGDGVIATSEKIPGKINLKRVR
jgi:hypothetical protein